MKYKEITEFVLMEKDDNIAIAMDEQDVGIDIDFVDVRLEGNKIFIETNIYENTLGLVLNISPKWENALKAHTKVYLCEVRSKREFGKIVETVLEVS